MSVIFSQRAPGRRWLSLWPLALFLLLMLVGGLWIWQAW
ncbi:nickel transporter, partial [Salmonella enterica]|nr:nickel transporter [Salmonella enterica subsp. enterica serovar Kentucky]